MTNVYRCIAVACCIAAQGIAQTKTAGLPFKSQDDAKASAVTKGQAKNVEGFELKRDHKAEKPKVTFDDIIQHVVAKDPDVVIAQREVELAQAKLNAITQLAIEKVKVKQQRLEALQQRIRSGAQLMATLRDSMTIAEKAASTSRQRYENGTISLGDVQQSEVASNQFKEKYVVAESDVEAVRIEYAQLNAEMNEYRKQVSDSRQGTGFNLNYVTRSDVQYSPFVVSPSQRELGRDVYSVVLQYNSTDNPGNDSFPKRLAVVMGKKISLEDVPEEGIYPLDAAQKILSASGVDGMVKIHASYDPKLYKVTRLKLPKAQLPVRTWFELLKDECRLTQGHDCEIYARDYGLMITNRNDAPAGAIPVFQVEGFKIDPSKTTQPEPADDGKSKAPKTDAPKEVQGVKIDPSL